MANTVQENEFSKNDQELTNHLAQAASIFKQEADKLQNSFTVRFTESPRISTYLYAMVAGNYKAYENNTPGFPPMKIYARASLLESVNHEEMFKVT